MRTVVIALIVVITTVGVISGALGILGDWGSYFERRQSGTDVPGPGGGTTDGGSDGTSDGTGDDGSDSSSSTYSGDGSACLGTSQYAICENMEADASGWSCDGEYYTGECSGGNICCQFDVSQTGCAEDEAACRDRGGVPYGGPNDFLE